MAYGLEKIVSTETPIYQQLTNYYEFCDHTRRMSKATMYQKTHSINDFVEFSRITSLEEITNRQVYDWIDYQEGKGNTGRTINGCLSQLIVMLKWERDDNISMPNLKISRIMLQKEIPPRRIFYTREQINRALTLADRREWLMIKLAFDCGLRMDELRNIRLCDIDGRRIRIVGKGSKLRHVIMSEETRIRLDDWIQREGIYDYIWKSGNKKPLHGHTMRRAMRRPFEAAGFKNFYPHALRHSYATDLKNLGLPTRKIQVGMGHSSEAITERYLHDLDGFDIDEIYNVKYSAPDPGLR